MKDAFKTGEGNNQIHEQSALGLGGEIFYDVEERRAIKFWRLGGIIFSVRLYLLAFTDQFLFHFLSGSYPSASY
jgi:hypothetical protein